MVRRVLASDLMSICSWYKDRGITPPRLSCFPETGFMEPGVAAGFLYKTDSAICLLDTYISNPAAPLRARYRALAQVTHYLLDSAHRGGAEHVTAICKSRGILKLSDRFGLRPSGVYLMAGKDLR